MRGPGHFFKAFLFSKNSMLVTRSCTRHRHLDISHICDVIYLTYISKYFHSNSISKRNKKKKLSLQYVKKFV